MLVKKSTPAPVECIVRGYITGSGWKDYQKTGAVCGIALPQGLVEAARLDEPIFTPSTKAAVGDHDLNITFDAMIEKVGKVKAEKMRDATVAIYQRARFWPRPRASSSPILNLNLAWKATILC